MLLYCLPSCVCVCPYSLLMCLQLPCVPGDASPSHSSTAQGEPPCGEDYRRLLKCLALEQWKAGGCFQHFLEQQGADAEVQGGRVGVQGEGGVGEWYVRVVLLYLAVFLLLE